MKEARVMKKKKKKNKARGGSVRETGKQKPDKEKVGPRYQTRVILRLKKGRHPRDSLRVRDPAFGRKTGEILGDALVRGKKKGLVLGG